MELVHTGLHSLKLQHINRIKFIIIHFFIEMLSFHELDFNLDQFYPKNDTLKYKVVDISIADLESANRH